MIGLNLRPWVPHMHCFKTDDAATVPGCHRSRLDDDVLSDPYHQLGKEFEHSKRVVHAGKVF